MSPRRDTGSWLVSFVVFGAAVVAIAVAVAGFVGRPEQPTSDAAPREVALAAQPARPAAFPAAGSAPTPDTLVEPAQAAERQHAAATSAAGGSLPFKLDALPVFDAGGTDFETDTAVAAPPVRPAAKGGSRRAASSTQR